MIRKVLIANRGEIASRIATTCRKMGITTVAVYSDADKRARHVQNCDEAVHVGASPASESYLNIEKLIAAAKRTGTDAVHPGYGFLAENATFAQAVIDAGLTWIGAPPNVIDLMGDKRQAKLALKDVPLIPGYNGDDQRDETLIKAANEIGFPVMIKAAAGGGGKGMRKISDAGELASALAAARREAQQAFGDGTLILERAIENPRHIEIQIFGDQHGNVVALGERECSIQRRHQKIIEETPSPAVDDDLRAKMSETAVSIGLQIGYVGAGTIEFLLDSAKNYYFMEMNTRLQVEHRVTEMRYGVDLVEMQIRAAEGARLDAFYNAPAQLKTHAIQVRVYSEDPANGFLPTTGKVLEWFHPIDGAYGLIDSSIQAGDEVSVFYDPMQAKIICFDTGGSRETAIRKLDYTLSRATLFGLRTNLDFLRRVINHEEFIAGNFDTGFIERHPELLADAPLPIIALIAAGIAKATLNNTAAGKSYWRNNPNQPLKQTFIHGDKKHVIQLLPLKDTLGFTVSVDGESMHLEIGEQDEGYAELRIDGYRQKVSYAVSENSVWVHCAKGTFALEWVDPLPVGKAAAQAEGSLRAPMPGTILDVHVKNEDFVRKGDILIIMEAMKMEHRILAPYDGQVKNLTYASGQYVQAGVTLLEIEAQSPPTSV